MKQLLLTIAIGPMFLTGVTTALADQQAAVDGCIDQIRTVGGPDAEGGEILNTDWSQAGYLITFRDRGGTIWECIAYDDGAVGDLRVADAADDGGGAMSGSEYASVSEQTIEVHFQPGTSSANYSGSLGSGEAVRYSLGAGSSQNFYVDLTGNSSSLNYIIYVPDGDILFESSQGGYTYSGQLYENGEHTVEVFYNGNEGTYGNFDIFFEID